MVRGADNYAMSVIDISVVCLLLFFGIFGVFRGLVRQIFFLGGLIAGHLVNINYGSFIVLTLNLQFQYAELVSYFVILLAVFTVVYIAGCFLAGKIRGTKLAFIDRLLGLFAGLVKGGLLAVLLVFVLVVFMPKGAKSLRESITAPYAIAAGKWITNSLPPQISDSFFEKVRAVEKLPPELFFFGK